MITLTERWKLIEEAPMYEISEYGDIHNTFTGAPIKQSQNQGYMCVSLQINGKAHRRRVHRLVALAFIPNPDGKSEVNHIDGNKTNNHVSNLEWCTPSENLIHAYKTGLRSRDASVAYTKRRKRVIRDDGVMFESMTEAAKHLGLTTSRMSKIIRGNRPSKKDGHIYSYDSGN